MGKIDRVDVGVINHIAEDYIPVIASVGADRVGRSHNINADEAAGAIARAMGAYKVMFLTDVAGWLRDPADPSSVISEAGADDVEAALLTDAGRDAAEAAGLHRSDPRGRDLRAHHRRPAAALAAARAVHGRRHRHEGEARFMTALAPTYARYDVKFAVRLRAACSTDADGVEYLDFLSGIAVNNLGHCHPAVVSVVQEQVARLIHVSNLFYNDAQRRLAERLTSRSFGDVRVLLQLGRRGQRGRDQARAQGAPAR